MRPVYSVQFRVQATSPGTPLFDSLEETVVSWVKRWYAQRKGLEVDLPRTGGTTSPIDLHSIEIDSAESSGQTARLFMVSWSYPEDGDSKLLWRSDVTVAQSQDVVEFGLALRVGSLEFKITPPVFDVFRPQLVKSVTEKYVCSLGAHSVSPTARQVGIEDVPEFTALLQSPDRRLPIVLLTREPFTERFFASPLRVADTLVGLAHVYTLQDKWTAFRLTSEVGKHLSCFNGAVRLYWPGRHPDGTLRADRPYMPDEVKELGDAVAAHLMRRLAPMSAFRHAELETTRIAKSAIAAERSAQHAAMRREVTSGRLEREILESELLKLVDETDKLRASLSRAEIERDDALLRAMELEEENGALRDNFKTVNMYAPAQDSLAPQQNEFEPSTVRDAVDKAAKDFTSIDVWPTAEESADRSDFARPAEVYQALLAIQELSEMYFDNNQKGSIGPWDEFFVGRGFKYAPTESQTAINMFGHERDFVRDGVKKRMLRHLTLGGGDKKNCVQIYFEPDETKGTMSIGYCGRHLRTDKYRG